MTVLVTLDQNHHDHLRRLLERCCAIATEYIQDNGGLYQVLTSDEMLESDVAGDREDRRERQGFVAPTSAASFLALAATTPLAAIVADDKPDPITRAYFRAYQPAAVAPPGKPRPRRDDPPPPPAAQRAEWLEILREADLLPTAPPPLLPAAEGAEPADVPLFQRALQTLRERDLPLYDRRVQELSYLANVLIAGAEIDGRRYRPVEAAEAAMATCDHGLRHLLSQPCPTSEARALAELKTHDAVKLFRIGWHKHHPSPRND